MATTRKTRTTANPVNPAHHKNFVGDMQWAQNYITQLRRGGASIECLNTIVASWADKYIDRLGRKDDSLQEVKKSLWYMRYAATLHDTLDPSNLTHLREALTPNERHFCNTAEQLFGRPQARIDANAILTTLSGVLTMRRQMRRDFLWESYMMAYAIKAIEGRPEETPAYLLSHLA